MVSDKVINDRLRDLRNYNDHRQELHNYISPSLHKLKRIELKKNKLREDKQKIEQQIRKLNKEADKYKDNNQNIKEDIMRYYKLTRIAAIHEARQKNMTYPEIAKKLGITAHHTRHMYESMRHRVTPDMIKHPYNIGKIEKQMKEWKMLRLLTGDHNER